MCRKILDKEFKYPYSLSNIIWVIQSKRWAGQGLGREELRTGRGSESQRKSLLGRLRRRGEGNITFVIQEMGWGHGLD